MTRFFKNFLDRIKNPRTLGLAIFLSAGAIVGIACVLFMRAFESTLAHNAASLIGSWTWVVTPLIFLFSVELIRRTAPCADGAGIPQTVFASTHLSESSLKQLYPLVSFRTMVIKILALLAAVWAGAATGREGPTVHVAACLFLAIVLLAQRIFPKIKLNSRSAVIAGGAAGLAAAFNTPLAGVTFAIEELSTDYFSSIKETVLMAIIVAGIAAKSMTGEYSYFGRLAAPNEVAMTTVLMIGIAGGILGAFFSTLLSKGRQWVSKFQAAGFLRYTIPVFFALGLLGLNEWSTLNVLGPGNETVQPLLAGRFDQAMFGFPFFKIAATLLTYWSGIAGGIFAPCLASGAALGADIAQWTGDGTAPCAILGMAALLAGTIQAPMTAFVIIFEMTGHHQMLLPVMLAALVANMTAKALGAQHLYQFLAKTYGKVLQYHG
jgi:H+/Cl- antiporter ClcA